MDMLLGLLDQFAQAVFSILPFVLLYEGARQWGLSSKWRKATGWFAGGLTLLAIAVGMNAVAARFGEVVLATTTAPLAIPAVDDSWGRDFSPEKREEISRMLGKHALRERQEVRNYVDKTGVWRPYCATEEDLKDIMKVTAQEATLKEVSRMNHVTITRVLLWGVVAMLVGGVVGFELRKKTQNPTNSHDH